MSPEQYPCTTVVVDLNPNNFTDVRIEGLVADKGKVDCDRPQINRLFQTSDEFRQVENLNFPYQDGDFQVWLLTRAGNISNKWQRGNDVVLRISADQFRARQLCPSRNLCKRRIRCRPGLAPRSGPTICTLPAAAWKDSQDHTGR